MSTPTAPLYSPAYFELEKKYGTTAQQAAADALIRARNATQASARRHSRAAELRRQLAEAAATAEAHANEAAQEHQANLAAQAEAYKAARLAHALPQHLPDYYDKADTV